MPKPDDLKLDHVANLARIELTAQEKEHFAAQLGDVLTYISQLNEVDVTGVEPTAHAFPVVNVWAADIAQPGLPVADALRNAPQRSDNFFVVPKVVD
jgi:aspartyl-tRNA(Asn)/glutamyl-tRNA(Gln) amidotransferase subunit C